MPRKTNNVRKLTRTGKSQSIYVIIPKDFIRSLGWREKQRVLVKRVPRGVAIIDAKTKKRKKKL
jgi:bifunctional DNA-binding transcriptional regulator/antitoxin component of YhaV-PrlF toxin-antitoxin module